MAQKFKKRKDGRYARQVTYGYRIDGSPLRKNIYGRTIAELNQKYNEFQNLMQSGVAVSKENVTMNELIDQWYKLEKEPYIKDSTKNHFLNNTNYIKEKIGFMKVREITKYNINEMLLELTQEEKFSKAGHVLIKLKSVFNYAVDNGIIAKNPAANIKNRYKTPEKRALFDWEDKKIEKAQFPLADMALIMTFRYTGMRKGEIAALQLSDIDMTKRIITVNKSIVRVGNQYTLAHRTKTPAGIRKVPILPILYNVLEKYIASVKNTNTFLFESQNHTFLSSSVLDNRMKKYKSKIGLASDTSWHMFRHTFATDCVKAGIPLKKVQLWMGHENISTLLDIYNHVTESELQDTSKLNQYYDTFKMQSAI